MVYNMTNVTNANNIYWQVYYLNQEAGGLIGVFILVCLFLVLFMAFKKTEQDTKETFLTCSVIVAIVSVLFWTIQLITWSIMIYPIIMVFASLIVFKFSD